MPTKLPKPVPHCPKCWHRDRELDRLTLASASLIESTDGAIREARMEARVMAATLRATVRRQASEIKRLAAERDALETEVARLRAVFGRVRVREQAWD
jgi:cell division protein FtsB